MIDRMAIIGENFDEEGPPQQAPEPTYLGDGLYAEYDGEHIIVYSHNGIHATNTVYLDQNVAACLSAFMKRVLP